MCKKKNDKVIVENGNFDTKSKTCCFTGHRPQKLPWGFNEQDARCIDMRNYTKTKIEEAIQNGYITFISGMALGFDIICAELVLELKKKYPQIKLMSALPCMTQDKVWKPSQKERYHKVLKQADQIWCENETYTDTCMMERNHFMIINSSLLIALYDGKHGGTEKTILDAKNNGLKVVEIKPVVGYSFMIKDVADLFDTYQKKQIL